MEIWNVDPVLFKLGPLQVRYYGVCFAVALLGGYLLWRWQILRSGRSEAVAERVLLPSVLAVVAGARLGHIFFYEPEIIAQNPLRAFYVWEGGLASHGAAIALVATLWWYSRREKIAMEEVSDRFAFSIAWAAAWVRIGNLFNSEIVGRVTTRDYGIKFPRFDGVALENVPYRIPTQIYEAVMGFAVMGLLLWADRALGGEKRPRGMMIALCLILYFSGRFTVEFFKAQQGFVNDSNSSLTMGQYLSLPFVAAGIVWLWSSLRRRGAR